MKQTLHIISHSHWDREWYISFEEHRMRLVELLDSIIDRYPLSAITDCGSRSDFSGNLVDAVNEYIRSHGLK